MPPEEGSPRPNGLGKETSRCRRGRPGAMIPERQLRKGRSLRGSERPLRGAGSSGSVGGAPPGALIRQRQKRRRGAKGETHVRAGATLRPSMPAGEQAVDVGHSEPFLFFWTPRSQGFRRLTPRPRHEAFVDALRWASATIPSGLCRLRSSSLPLSPPRVHLTAWAKTQEVMAAIFAPPRVGAGGQ